MKEVMYDYFYQIEDKHWWFQGRRKIVMELIDKYYKKTPGAKVLDVGCGTGMMLKYLSKYGEVWGTDKDPKAIEYSKTKAPNTEIISGSIPEKIPEGKFDLVTALDIVEHIERDVEALKVIFNTLKNNGVLVMTVPAYQFLWSTHDEINEHKRRYQLPELKEKLERAGFNIIKISYYNVLLFLPIAFFLLLKKLFGSKKPKSHFEKMPNYIVNWLLEKIFSSERYLLPFFNFPLGVSIIAIASKKNKNNL